MPSNTSKYMELPDEERHSASDGAQEQEPFISESRHSTRHLDSRLKASLRTPMALAVILAVSAIANVFALYRTLNSPAPMPDLDDVCSKHTSQSCTLTYPLSGQRNTPSKYSH